MSDQTLDTQRGVLAEPSGARVSSLPARALLRLANSRELMLFVLIVILSVGMAIIYPNNFPTSYNASAVLLNAAQNGILVTGMMLLMIAGVFDLSIGSTLALAGVWAGVVVGWWDYPAPTGILVGLVVGAIAGMINGFIVTRLAINALITTLATMAIFRGLTYVTAGTGVTPISNEFKLYGQTVFFGLQTPFWVMLAIVAVGTWAVARRASSASSTSSAATQRPRSSPASASAADACGFVIMGMLAGVAGVLGASRLNSAVVSAGIGVELSVITAAVLGGASLKGGEGTIIGGVLGVLFIALVQNAMIINGVGVFWQGIIIGSVLLLFRLPRPLQANPPGLNSNEKPGLTGTEQQATGTSGRKSYEKNDQDRSRRFGLYRTGRRGVGAGIGVWPG
jgi:ribose transport system permease protein